MIQTARQLKDKIRNPAKEKSARRFPATAKQITEAEQTERRRAGLVRRLLLRGSKNKLI